MVMDFSAKHILLGSTFPLSLVRRRVVIVPSSLETLKAQMAGSILCSFWGHANTLASASRVLGRDVTPGIQRPALELNDDGLPVLQDEVFRECWVLSPDYVPGFRPAIGEEVSENKITGWQVLLIRWENDKDSQ
jgi:hypothetical protein